MNGGEFLQTSHAAEPMHGPFSSSKRPLFMVCKQTTVRRGRVLGPIVEPAARFLPVCVADDLHRRAVGSQFVGHQ